LHIALSLFCSVFLFFNDTPPPEIYTLSLHDALPISTITVHKVDIILIYPNPTPGYAKYPETSNTIKVISDDQGNIEVTGSLTFTDRKSTRLNSSHVKISYAVFCLKKKRNKQP